MNVFGNENMYNNLADFLDQSAFDEKMEIDLKKDMIHNIYHVENKYYVPLLTGKFSEMYEYATDNMVHPDDSHFKEFMNIKTFKDRAEQAEQKGLLREQCRQRLIDGSYRWVEYIALSGVENGVPEDIVYMYVYDIQNQKDRISGATVSKSYSTAYRNPLTGLYSSEEFPARMFNLTKGSNKKWCILAIDIQHFKIFNSWFGHEKGDYVLARIGSILLELEKKGNAVASYFGRDNFGLAIEYNEDNIQELYERIKDVIYAYSHTLGFLPAIGVYIIDDNNQLNIDGYDKSRVAVDEAKNSYTERIKIFDEKSYDKKKYEYQLLTEFQHALHNGDISFYLQPQCRISNGHIVGAEALARWIRKDGSLISPGIFIPFLEKNGFITDLDKRVWECVCRFIRSLIDKGITPVPISINVSKVDILSMDVSSYLYGLIEKYNIPPRLLKVEITESAYSENYEVIKKEIARLNEKKFKVLMDDFGSGYSSLNMLDKINVDTLKLDMAFMPRNTNFSKKGISIVESIISMTKLLNIPLIVEGVENKEQIQFLEGLGCLYAQGYYFYKPMSIKSFIDLIQQPDIIDTTEIHVRTTEVFHTRDFLDENLFTDTVLNQILGPVAFYVQDRDGNLNILRYNQQFYDCISDIDMDQRVNGIQDYIYEEDRTDFYRMLENAQNNSVKGGECTVRFRKSKGGEFWYYMHLYYLRDTEQGKLFYGKVSNATEMHEQGMAFYELLKLQAYSCMRIDLTNEMIYDLDKFKPFDDPTARYMNVEKCMKLTADAHILDDKKKEDFLEFFDPTRLKRSHQSGIYRESFETNFLFGQNYEEAVFNTYYIKFVPNQTDNVYVFVNKK